VYVLHGESCTVEILLAVEQSMLDTKVSDLAASESFGYCIVLYLTMTELELWSLSCGTVAANLPESELR